MSKEHLAWELRIALREICDTDPGRAAASWERERTASSGLADAVRALRPSGSLAQRLDEWDRLDREAA